MSQSIETEFPDWCERRAKECRETGDEYDAQMFDEAAVIWRELNTRLTAQAVAVDDAMVVRALRAFGDAMDEAGFLTYGGMDVGSRQDCIRAALQAAMGGVE